MNFFSNNFMLIDIIGNTGGWIVEALSLPLDHQYIQISRRWGCRRPLTDNSKQCSWKCLTQHLYDICLRTNKERKESSSACGAGCTFSFYALLTMISALSSCGFIQQPQKLSEFQNKCVCVCVYIFVYISSVTFSSSLSMFLFSLIRHGLSLPIEQGSATIK